MAGTASALVEQFHTEWLESDEPHWGDKIAWKSAEEIAYRIDAAHAEADVLKSCELPPDGWYCTRAKGHDGPCAAYPEQVNSR